MAFASVTTFETLTISTPSTFTTAFVELISVFVVEWTVNLPAVSISVLPIICAEVLLLSLFSDKSTATILPPVTITFVTSITELFVEVETTSTPDAALTVVLLFDEPICEVVLDALL